MLFTEIQMEYKCQDRSWKTMIVANGLTEETAALADAWVRIPMAGKVESLNAAVAASVLLFETARQRRQ